MAFKTGEKRPANAGRKKGSLNRDTQKVLEIMEREKCDPIEFLCWVVSANVSKLKEAPELEHRISAAKELASYAYPKRKAIEHSVDDSTVEKILTYEEYLKGLNKG